MVASQPKLNYWTLTMETQKQCLKMKVYAGKYIKVEPHMELFCEWSINFLRYSCQLSTGRKASTKFNVYKIRIFCCCACFALYTLRWAVKLLNQSLNWFLFKKYTNKRNKLTTIFKTKYGWSYKKLSRWPLLS